MWEIFHFLQIFPRRNEKQKNQINIQQKWMLFIWLDIWAYAVSHMLHSHFGLTDFPLKSLKNWLTKWKSQADARSLSHSTDFDVCVRARALLSNRVIFNKLQFKWLESVFGEGFLAMISALGFGYEWMAFCLLQMWLNRQPLKFSLWLCHTSHTQNAKESKKKATQQRPEKEMSMGMAD